MKNVLRLVPGAVAVLACSASVASAQVGSPITISRGVMELIPFTGFMISEKLVDGPLGTDLGSANGAVFGAQVGLPLNPYAAILGGIAYSSGDLRAGAPIVGGITVGTSRSILYDAAVQVRFAGNDGARPGVVPFVQLGAGAAQRKLSSLGMSVSSTDFVVTGGAGLDLALSPRLAVRVMAKDYYGPADFGSFGPIEMRVEDFHTVALTAGMRLTF